jgi:hypothetical protein
LFTKLGSTLLASLAAGALIAGCGGGGSTSSTADTTATDSTSTTSTALSTAAYKAKLTDVFCPLGTDLQTLGAQAKAAQSLDDLDAALKTAEGKFEDAIAKLQALSPPAAVQATHEKLIATLTTFKSVTAAAEQAVAGGDHSEIRTKVLAVKAAAQTFNSALDQEKKDFSKEGVVFSGC